MSEKLWGVIVADVVGSSRTRGLRSVLSSGLRLVTASHLREKLIRLPYAVTAGDEFQTVAADLRHVPDLLFDLRGHFRRAAMPVDVPIRTRVTQERAALSQRPALPNISRVRTHRIHDRSPIVSRLRGYLHLATQPS